MENKLEVKASAWEKPLKNGSGNYLSMQIKINKDDFIALAKQHINSLDKEIVLNANLFKNDRKQSANHPDFQTPYKKPVTNEMPF
jgi:uncharacterized protein (DUF736 family)